jgi:hypothetical protein
MPLPNSAKITVWGMKPRALPAMNGNALTPDTPAARLVTRLLPAGNSRNNSAVENGWSWRNLSSRRIRSENKPRT